VVIEAAPGASVDAAVAAAMHVALGKLVAPQQADIDAAYQAALAAVPDGPARIAGIAVGEKAAAAVLALRADDGAMAPDNYTPSTTPGVYVPTTSPAVPHWGKRKPWVLSSGDQLRPGAPPALSSELWARDFNEIKALGSKTSARRSVEQTEIARFWEATQPVIYYPLARAVASQPGRDVTQNARLLAAVGMAMDDALVAIFDAKYAYNFWRPVTAIRNGDLDGNPETEIDPTWQPLDATPMHPEYPCAHCILSGTAAAVIESLSRGKDLPELTLTSPTAPGVTHRWSNLDSFTTEVANARVWAGFHYRSSTRVGADMGRQVGRYITEHVMQPVGSAARHKPT
jgi:hypothetical protein